MTGLVSTPDPDLIANQSARDFSRASIWRQIQKHADAAGARLEWLRGLSSRYGEKLKYSRWPAD